LIPAILGSWYAGNHFGAFAARNKRLDNTVLPVGYVLTATPYMWLGILLAWIFGIVLGIFPISGAYSYAISAPSFSWTFISSFFMDVEIKGIGHRSKSWHCVRMVSNYVISSSNTIKN